MNERKNMHLHTLTRPDPFSPRVACEGCDIDLRLATHDEANFVHATGIFDLNGPMLWNNNVVVVPFNFTLMEV